MPRDGSSIYHRPPGTDGTPNYTVESARYNAFTADVEQDLNLPRPVVAGGTGATSPDSALDSLAAEKFKQVVTNWDSMVWRAGSFYAATTATGIAPVAGHAFAGTAYYANATDFVLKAIDLTDPANPVEYTRVMAAGVWSPWSKTGNTGTSGSQIGEFTFDAGITFPPASGTVRFNNATQNSTTELFISHLTAAGVDVTTSLPFALRNGYDVAVADKNDVTKYKVFTIVADPVLSGGDIRVLVTVKNSGTDLTATHVLLNVTPGSSVRYDIAQTLTAAQQLQARQNIGAVLRSYLAGLTMSTPGASANFTVQPGVAADSTNTVLMTLNAAITKTMGAWVAGAGGALDTGTMAAGYYDVYLIRRPDTGVLDITFTLFTNPSPTLPANYTQSRRIGTLVTNNGTQWLKFIQTGDEFLWDAPAQDVSALAVGTGGQIVTAAAPPNCEAKLSSSMVSNTAGTIALVHSLVANAAAITNNPLGNAQYYTWSPGGAAIADVKVRLNASRQYRIVSNATAATCQFYITTLGYIDRRGRDS